MPIFQADIRLKTMIELGLEDIRKNEWLLNDILADTVSNQYLRERYGSQIESCKQWLSNNRINIFLSEQQADKQEFPSIDIELGSSNEKSEMKHMGDLSVETIDLLPNNINRPIAYLIKPVPGSYNSTTGAFTFSSNVDLAGIVPGQIVVNPSTGTGYVIQSVTMANQVNLLTGLSLGSGIYGIIPEHQYYKARIGHTFMQEMYRVTCNANDTQTLLWLHSITVYSLLRYREVLLERDGYAESMISSGKIYANPDYSDAGQVIWSRDIDITGQVENRWYMQPHRIIEDTQFPPGGIKIISNITDTSENLETVNWSTIEDTADEGDAD
jgi:hypothetical protein